MKATGDVETNNVNVLSMDIKANSKSNHFNIENFQTAIKF